jgi:hypothetical protein
MIKSNKTIIVPNTKNISHYLLIPIREYMSVDGSLYEEESSRKTNDKPVGDIFYRVYAQTQHKYTELIFLKEFADFTPAKQFLDKISGTNEN